MTTGGPPAVSVVVPTHNRAGRLPALVDALAGQVDMDRPYEVVIVDDASTDHTWATLQDLAASAPVPIRPIRMETNQGPAAARNRGWQATASGIVAFTDDDCLPRPGWLAALTAAVEQDAIAQGATVPDPRVTGRMPFSRSITIDAETGRFETCNIAYPRPLLEKTGGFDEGYRHPYGEDIDLAMRAIGVGAAVRWVPEAVVEHAVWTGGFRGALRDARRHEGLVRTVARNPSYRPNLHRRMWERPSHPPAALAALGLAVAAVGRTPGALAVGAIAGLPYLVHRTSTAPVSTWRRWPVTIPAAFVVDLAEIAVLARASIRYRTVVL